VWPLAVALAAFGIVAKVAGGWWIGRRDGLPKRNALALGLTLVPRGEFSILLAGIATTIGLESVAATVGLLVLMLSLVGTVLLRFAPEIGRRAFPPPRAKSLAERGFSPELAGFTEPAAPPPRPDGRDAHPS
jgi:CPA2 family monovalent cation:H+ antiporter-2